MLDTNQIIFLQTAMNHELNICRKLFELLADEQRQLETNQLEKVNQLLKEKKTLLDELEKMANQRLSCFGIKVIHANHSHLFEQNISGNQELSQQWRNLKMEMDKCHVQNEINGRIISLSRKSIERTMNTFRQSLRPNNTATYSANGKAVLGSISIASAKA
ncbi:MAG: flagellar protein FlgN [Kangiellaceae bacterium]|jgi:flagellar biosynthesis/type III secretory pathway chaperone|nr:flagellar protein FlgN [Kangiellaceae bacterium]